MPAPATSTAPPPAAAPATKDRIRQAAEELYVLRGHDGFSFGDVAAAIATTRANIHHHFGTKRLLMAALVDGFAASAEARIAGIWGSPGESFHRRMRAQEDDLRRFHARFNPAPGSRNVWSPVARIRLDHAALGSLADAALDRVNAAYDAALGRAVEEAARRGELRPHLARSDVVRLLRTTFLSCGPITQDRGGFAEVELLLRSLARLVALDSGAAGDGH
jgi:AcrR family transcriptional regulator